MQTISRASVASRIESPYEIEELDITVNNNSSNFKANKILKVQWMSVAIAFFVRL